MKAAALEKLQSRAQAALANSPFYELRDLQVQERGRALWISGCVTSFYHKQLAQEVVRSVCTESEVINMIHVKGEEDAVPQSLLPPT
jgi:osmotically-inducible protein OsmY